MNCGERIVVRSARESMKGVFMESVAEGASLGADLRRRTEMIRGHECGLPDDEESGGRGIVMEGVRECCEAYPVELVHSPASGRLYLRAKNEGGNNITMVDLYDVLAWLQRGPLAGHVAGGFAMDIAERD